jgi:competence protein ComEA
MFKVMIGVLIFTVVTIFIFINIDPNISQTSISLSSELDIFTASINGEVLYPGTYLLEKDKVLEDLIVKAGGVTTNADQDAYRLSIELKHTLTYYIAPLHNPNDVCGDELLVKVGINTGSKEELMTLNSIGASIAQSIIDYRTSEGEFTYLEDIMSVSGIGNSTFSKIKNHINLL